MKPGDLVRFAPEAWGDAQRHRTMEGLEDRPLGIVLNVEDFRDGIEPETFLMVTAMFPTDEIPWSSNIKDFEVVSEAR